MPQIKPPDLRKAVGVGIFGFWLGAGACLASENRAAVGFPALVDRIGRARLIQKQGVDLYVQAGLLALLPFGLPSRAILFTIRLVGNVASYRNLTRS